MAGKEQRSKEDLDTHHYVAPSQTLWFTRSLFWPQDCTPDPYSNIVISYSYHKSLAFLGMKKILEWWIPEHQSQPCFVSLVQQLPNNYHQHVGQQRVNWVGSKDPQGTSNSWPINLTEIKLSVDQNTFRTTVTQSCIFIPRPPLPP